MKRKFTTEESASDCVSTSTMESVKQLRHSLRSVALKNQVQYNTHIGLALLCYREIFTKNLAVAFEILCRFMLATTRSRLTFTVDWSQHHRTSLKNATKKHFLNQAAKFT